MPANNCATSHVSQVVPFSAGLAKILQQRKMVDSYGYYRASYAWPDKDAEARFRCFLTTLRESLP
jgi:hypothetical protein